jgi:hypothetical protein
MKRNQYKIIVCDGPGAKIFEKWRVWWDSAKKIDESYMGPEYYWCFYQFGDFNRIDITLVKWEIWSAWRIPKFPDELNKGAFIGANCGLFFYSPSDEVSFEKAKELIQIFLEKRKSNASPFLALALYDGKEMSADALAGANPVIEQREYFESKGGKLLYFDTNLLETDLRDYMTSLYRELMVLLEPNLVKLLDLEKEFWYLSMPELRAVLHADMKGIKIKPRLAPPPPPPTPELEQPVASEESKMVGVAEGAVKPVGEAPAEPVVSSPSEPVAAVESPPIDSNKVAISPEGEIVPLKPDITQEEIVELVRKGYKLPEWVVIPRHCPKCYNQNQKSINQVIDKTVILMQNPLIYGIKYVCGNCGHNFHMN